MEYVIGVILILSFFGLAYYCVKGYNLMIGFLFMTVLWTVLSLAGTMFLSPQFLAENSILQFGNGTETALQSILNKIFQSASENWGITLVNVCWGAWFGRVLMDTGIASTIIRKVVELGGDRPVITVMLLNIATAFIFTAMMGAGPVIAIGVIVLPILLSLGIPKGIAMFTFMASVSAGMYLNPVLHAQLRAFVVPVDGMPAFSFGWYAVRFGYYGLFITLVVVNVLTAFYLRKRKVSHAWAAHTSFQVQNVIIGSIMPRSELVVCVVFALLTAFAFFRGPLTLFGCGAATLGVLSNVASFSVPFLFCVFAIPAITVNVGSCITQSWVAWGLAYTKVESRDFLKLSIPFAYVTSIILYIMTYFTVTGLGTEWFL